MRVLVVGGSVFAGRAVVEQALAAGHQVTVFNRGRSGPTPAGAEQVVGDRETDLDLLTAHDHDLVVDTCGFVPSVVASGADRLADRAGHYVFLSSINVFPGWPGAVDYHASGTWHGDPDAGPDATGGHDGSELYGWLKAGCEQAVIRAFGAARSTVLRAGALAGPNDSAVARLPWWIDRIAHGGDVLAPGAPADPVALIDARDLARFALRAVPGVFETGGPVGRDTRAELLTTCREVTGSDAGFTWVADDWLARQDVEAWTQLPLWVPRADAPSLFAHDNAAAVRAGLTFQPLIDTVRDTWRWMQQLSSRWIPAAATPGLPPERERQLLRAWRERQVADPAR